MAGYTRQSTASIINGSPITAPPLNAEFNQVAAAFNPSTGHSHDGTSGNSPKINLATSVSGYLPAEHGGIGGANKMDATTAPLVTNDNTEGYAPGSLWENTTNGRIYICVGSSTGAAIWRELVQVITDNVIKPITTNTVDLGTNTERFQDLFLSGGVAAAGNAALGGTLSVTGNTTLSGTLGVTGNLTASGNASVTGTLGVTGDTTINNLTVSGTNSVNSASISSGAVDGTVIGNTTPAAGTFTTINAGTSLTAASATISGGSLDGAAIGATTPSTGAFTTINASGTTTLATVAVSGGAIDGTTIGATSAAAGNFTTISTSGNATIASAAISGGTLNGATIGATSPSTGSFTTLAASGGVTGDLTGNVVGNLTGNVTGNTTGNVTGDVAGNITAASGTSSFNNVTINGALDMNAGTTATITNLTSPTNTNDAATKGYVDTQVSNLVDSAPGTLDTLNELAAALDDDPNFSTTITNQIATKLPLAGGTMSGAIAMGTAKITGMGDPTAAQDAATKAYTDTQRDTRVAKTGDTMSGNLAMGSNNITGLATPTANDHASNKSYVDGLFQSTQAASTSATNASTSETNAATSETNASTSATAAATSETNAATSLATFQGQYQGAQSSAPTQNPDGSSLDLGDLYFDSTTNTMKVYGSGGWANAGSSVNGTSERNTYTATAGQTVFAATYDSGFVDVYLNGVKLLVGTDFTATNGTSITLSSGASVNDIVDIVAYGTFVLADHLTEVQSDAKYMPLAGGTLTGNTTISGTLTADGTATINSNNFIVSSTTPNIRLTETDVTDENTQFLQASGSLRIRTASDDYATTTERMRIDHGTGDISFYEDTGTTAKLFWDASAESLRLGTYNGGGTPSGSLFVDSNSNNHAIHIEETGGGSESWQIGVDTDGDLGFYNSTSTTASVTFDDSGSVGIGLSSSIGATLHVDPATNVTTAHGSPLIKVGGANSWAGNGSIYSIGLGYVNAGTNKSPAEIGLDTTSGAGFTKGDLVFATRDVTTDTAPTERMRIDSSGHVLINNTAYAANGTLVVQQTADSKGVAIIDSAEANTFFLENDGTINKIRNNSSVPIAFETNNAERMRIDSSGNVGIGISPNKPLTVATAQTASTPVEVLRLTGSGAYNSSGSHGAGAALSFGQYAGSYPNWNLAQIEGIRTGASWGGSLVFKTNNSSGETNSTEQWRITHDGHFKAATNGNGIDFSASQGSNASSSILDDYEIGTHNFVEPHGQASITVNRTYYIKIGDLVTVSGSVTVGSNTNPNGFNLTLPFTSSITSHFAGGGYITYTNLAQGSYDNLQVSVENGGSMLIFYYGAGLSLSNAQVSGYRIDFTVHYKT